MINILSITILLLTCLKQIIDLVLPVYSIVLATSNKPALLTVMANRFRHLQTLQIVWMLIFHKESYNILKQPTLKLFYSH